MSRNRAFTLQRDPEAVGDAADRSRDQPAPALLLEYHFREESNFEDPEPLFSMYSKAAEEEDKKMVNRWRKDADGIFIFTGLFSAAVATLLSVSLQSLVPNSQDTSSFYLGNIYEVLADPNATRPSIPPSVAEPPQFSPPRYAIWVNSLWFLSFIISLICALLATSSHQWARRYTRLTQAAQRSTAKRARMRAFFANGSEKMRIAWVVEGLTSLLHLSLFLFFAGVVIFLFNINHAVFNTVVWCIGLFLIVYGLITLMPIIRHDSPYYSPLSLPAWSLYASISYLVFNVIFSIRSDKIVVFNKWQGLRALKDRYRRWIVGGVEEAAEETASKQSSVIDAHILNWAIDTLGDDDKLETFFEMIPDFLNSKLVKDLKNNFPQILLKKFWKASNGYLDRTLLSGSVNDGNKSRRLNVGMKAMNVISNLNILSIPHDILFQSWDQVPQNVEMGYTLAPWCTNDNRNIALYAICIATRILATVRERNNRWIGLAIRVLGLSEQNLRNYTAHGDDSVSLAILIHVARRHFYTDFYDWGILSTLSELNIHNTLPGLQHDFCTLWNESVQEAECQGSDSYALGILRLTRHLYTDLHYRPDAAPPRFFAAIGDFDHILFQPDSYPPCNIREHGTDSTDYHAVPHSAQIGDSPTSSASPGGSAAPLPVENIVGIPLGSGQMITNDTIETSRPPTATSQLMAAQWVASNIGQISFTAPASSPAALSTTLLNEPLASSHAGPASILLPVSSTIPASPPSPKTELLSLLSGTSLPSPPDNATLPLVRARGLINKGNMCFVNTVLQLLVHCPPFWSHFRDLGRLMGQGGQGKGQHRTTVLVDATVGLLAEFIYKEKSFLRLQLAEKGKAREDERGKKEDSDTDPFIPTYIYDAMKEKRQFENMLEGGQGDAEEFFGVYLDALDKELLTIISRNKPASAGLNVPEPEGGSQSGEGQIEGGKRDFIASSARSPISRIFDGKFRTTVCMAGQLDNVIIESWRSLQLDIQPDSIHTIQDALTLISQPQAVHASPSGLREASEQVTVLIEALPPILVLHLKRFLYNAATPGGVVKISKPVQFTPELEIPPDIMTPAVRLPARYTLYGVLYHHGTSARGGHYTVDVLHPNDAQCGSGEAWLHIDDEAVSPVPHEDVFGIQDVEREDDRCAYMLFYRRATPTQT